MRYAHGLPSSRLQESVLMLQFVGDLDDLQSMIDDDQLDYSSEQE
jgi:hypothetical protein